VITSFVKSKVSFHVRENKIFLKFIFAVFTRSKQEKQNEQKPRKAETSKRLLHDWGDN